MKLAGVATCSLYIVYPITKHNHSNFSPPCSRYMNICESGQKQNLTILIEVIEHILGELFSQIHVIGAHEINKSNYKLAS